MDAQTVQLSDTGVYLFRSKDLHKYLLQRVNAGYNLTVGRGHFGEIAPRHEDFSYPLIHRSLDFLLYASHSLDLAIDAHIPCKCTRRRHRLVEQSGKNRYSACQTNGAAFIGVGDQANFDRKIICQIDPSASWSKALSDQEVLQSQTGQRAGLRQQRIGPRIDQENPLPVLSPQCCGFQCV